MHGSDCRVRIVDGLPDFPGFPPTASAFPPEPPTGITGAEVAALPPGAKVEILWDWNESRTRTVGEVLQASPNGVALMNVRIEGRHISGTPILSKVPYVNRLFKNTGVGIQAVPVHWVPIASVTSVQVLTPPPEGYIAPQLAINTNDQPEFERIGIDFDFATGDTFEIPAATVSDPRE